MGGRKSAFYLSTQIHMERSLVSNMCLVFKLNATNLHEISLLLLKTRANTHTLCANRSSVLKHSVNNGYSQNKRDVTEIVVQQKFATQHQEQRWKAKI